MVLELVIGIIIQNVELLSKMEDMKVKETHIQVRVKETVIDNHTVFRMRK